MAVIPWPRATRRHFGSAGNAGFADARPFMTLAFYGLAGDPRVLSLSDRGLFDGRSFSLSKPWWRPERLQVSAVA